MRRSMTWLIVVVAGGALLVGCGGGGSSSTASSQTSSTPAATSAPAATSSTPTTSTGAAGSLSVQQAVASCRSVVKRATTLPANLKAKVEGICNKAANGDVAGAQAAAKEVCVEVINSYPIPSGPAKEQALAACKKAK
jgi:hypothetical protein